MDFSRNNQGYGGSNSNNDASNEADAVSASNQLDEDAVNANNSISNNNQDLMRRLQATGGFPMDGNAFMFGPQGAMGGTGAGDQDDLLQLMYARRLRALGQLPDGVGGTTDDLLRLRQAGNATAATAAMFSGSDNVELSQLQLQQQQQQQQQFQQFQQAANMGYGFGGGGMFPQSMGMNMAFPPGASQAFMMQAAADQMPGGFGGRGFDDYLLRTQQHNAQEAIRGVHAEQQRIELSPSRFLAMQQQQQPAGMGMMDPMGSNKDDDKGGKSKKRYHKKKPSDMPRRPLSAYNLFFSEERERILKEIDAKEKGEDPPKEEDDDDDTSGKKPKALLRPLLPSEKKRRPHRKTHGKISFRQLAQMVGQRWKALPDEKRAYYQDLAKEDMARQKKAMEEYYLKQSEKAKNEDGEHGVGGLAAIEMGIKREV
jgi:guanyl-specific ribonuclease Sa